MLILEAVHLVLHAAALAEGGEVFVLGMGEQIKLSDLARTLIRLSGFVPDDEIPIRFAGLRPGEKLFEELVGVPEAAERQPVEKILMIRGGSPPDLAQFKPHVFQPLREATSGDADAVLPTLSHIVATCELGRRSAAAPTSGVVVSSDGPHFRALATDSFAVALPPKCPLGRKLRDPANRHAAKTAGRPW